MMDCPLMPENAKARGDSNIDISPRKANPVKVYDFVINNYSENEVCQVIDSCKKYAKKCIISKEVGKEGTPHLQCYIHLKKKILITGLQKLPGFSRSSCRPARNEEALIEYCQKEGNVLFRSGFPERIKLIEPDYRWEKEILEIINGEIDDRMIYWYWSYAGGTGKSSFCKYLVVRMDAMILSGKAADMKNGIVKWQEKTGNLPRLIVINIPRQFNLEYLSYEGVENIKDMLFYSGKYEGGMVAGNCPHLFVFANEAPNVVGEAARRWDVRCIDGRTSPVGPSPVRTTDECPSPSESSSTYSSEGVFNVLFD